MTAKSSPPATKQDITMLMDTMGKLHIRIDHMDEKIDRKTEETKLHFDFTVETIRNDLYGANRDEIQGIKRG